MRGRTRSILFRRCSNTSYISGHYRRKGNKTLLHVLGILFIVALLPTIHVARYRGNYVMIAVEESSSLALTTWPALSEDPAGVWLDPETRNLATVGGRIPFTAVMAVYYSASSLGVRYYDRLYFSSTGRFTLPLSRPLSWLVPGENGELVEAVDNVSRIVLGDLRFEGCDPQGNVTVRYGERKRKLGPGESWAVLLVRDDGGIREIKEERWREEVEEAMSRGLPVTRLMVTNMGLWSKKAVLSTGVGHHVR